MRRNSLLSTVLVFSLVAILPGLAVSPNALATEHQSVSKSIFFERGSIEFGSAQKVAIKKLVLKVGKDSKFHVIAAAGKLPGVSDSSTKLLAKKRGQVIKEYLATFGVRKSDITVTLKITELGIVPKTKLIVTYAKGTPVPVPTSSPTPSTSPSPTSSPRHTYAIGDVGPAGGIIFILPSSLGGLGGDYYYEAARIGWGAGILGNTPDTSQWGGGAETVGTNVLDPQLRWCNHADSVGAFGSAIGTGKANTEEMIGGNVGSSCASGAGNVAANYVSDGATPYDDWFLPSRDENTQLCRFAKNLPQSSDPCPLEINLTRGGFGVGGLGIGDNNDNQYWSSTESSQDAQLREGQKFHLYSYRFTSAPGTAAFVRPIRSFQ